MRRKPLSKEQRQGNDDRRQWSSLFQRCFACGKVLMFGDMERHVHEIIRKSETKDWRHRANYIVLCAGCHGEAHGGELTKDVLASLKMLLDPAHFDMDWLRANGIRRGIECGSLPERCDWILSPEAHNNRCVGYDDRPEF